MLNFLAPYKLSLFIGLVVLLTGYATLLNLQVTHYKNKTDALRIKVEQCQFSYKTLAEVAEKQNNAVTEMVKIGTDMQALGQKLLKDVQQANTIRQPKINAATIRLNAALHTDCASAIADAKKELLP